MINKNQFKEYSLNTAKMLFTEKAENILVFDAHNINHYCDFLMIATSNSQPHQNALSLKIEAYLYQYRLQKHNLDDKNNPWTLIDYGSLVIHLFLKEIREYYGLEQLWLENNGKLIHSL